MGDINVSLQLWDVDGMSLSGKMLETYVHDANAIIFTYDITNLKTFGDIDSWLREVSLVSNNNASKDGPIKILFGNKSDLNHISQVDFEAPNNYAKDNGLQGYVGSAKTGDQVNQVFYKLAADLAGVKVTKA